MSNGRNGPAALTLTLGAVSCGSDPETPEWEWPDPEPEPDPEPVAGKPRFIWVDAAANFPDFANSRENIARDLAKARDTGFTDIVVDVRPTTGDALFRTSAVEQVEWLGAWLPKATRRSNARRPGTTCKPSSTKARSWGCASTPPSTPSRAAT